MATDSNSQDASKRDAESTDRAELNVSAGEAREVANLLRYAIGLNTTAGLLSPTERRLATPTYLAVELAARILEGESFEDAARASEETWTGPPDSDHQKALGMVRANRERLRDAMSRLMDPKRSARFLEISEQQFLEMARPARQSAAKRSPQEKPAQE